MSSVLRGATLFTGGGGADLAMKIAGITPIWGIEYDEKIVEVARANGINASFADVRMCDPRTFEKVDFLHASPPLSVL